LNVEQGMKGTACGDSTSFVDKGVKSGADTFGDDFFPFPAGVKVAARGDRCFPTKAGGCDELMAQLGITGAGVWGTVMAKVGSSAVVTEGEFVVLVVFGRIVFEVLSKAFALRCLKRLDIVSL
jgi:hypothetical protein